MLDVYVIRGSVRELTWCYSLFVLGFLCTKCFSECFLPINGFDLTACLELNLMFFFFFSGVFIPYLPG